MRGGTSMGTDRLIDIQSSLQQLQDSNTRRAVGLATADDVSIVLDPAQQLQLQQRNQQLLLLQSQQQLQPYAGSMQANNHAFQHLHLPYHSIAQQQHQLLLEQHAQHQRERLHTEQSRVARQVSQFLELQAVSDAQNRIQHQARNNPTTWSHLTGHHRADTLNFRDPFSAGFPFSNTMDRYRMLTQQTLPPTPLPPSISLYRPTDLTQLPYNNLASALMGGGHIALGQHIARDNIMTSAIGRQHGIPVDGIPFTLPVCIARHEDSVKLSSFQVLLRKQIDAFQASDDDITTHTRGRNKPIVLGQVGIRCRHCAYLPVSRRTKGSTYFPATVLGIYQAAQNMSTTHIQCGVCSEMPPELKREFAQHLACKVASSGAGRPYWAQSAKQLGLVDTEDGIQFIGSLRPGARLLVDNNNKEDVAK
jgi:hypothetical protein